MMKTMTGAFVALTLTGGQALAEWEPDGPINLWIGFGAGGGTDTQARLLVDEIEARRGWTVIPDNKAGGGGAVMAAQLKDAPADGLTIGFAINTTFDFATLNSENIDVDDFTYITTTAGSQVGVLARADSGWTSLEDMVAAAKAGETIVWANWGDQVEAGAELIARKFDIDVNHLRAAGGRASVNALMSEDANVAWGGGVQRGLVEAGEVVILASAETAPLVQAPEGKTLSDYGIDESFSYQFMLAGPAGMSDEARDAIAAVIAEILTYPDSETRSFVAAQYPPGPVLISGDDLAAMIRENQAANAALMESMAAGE
jgi:tripartite-type tricarboxylate transporter receptor subunit TctC